MEIASLECETILELLLMWMTLSDLCALRSLNRSCFDVVRRATRSLCAAQTKSPDAMSHLVQYFHQLVRFDWRFVDLLHPQLAQCVTQLSEWRLSEVVFHRVYHLNDDHLAHVSRNMPHLKTLTVSECFQVKYPSLDAPLLTSLVIDDCLLIGLQPSTRLPALKSLAISSRVLDTINAQLLTKQLFNGSHLELLSLRGCAMVEQLLIDPDELPCLVTLNMAQSSRLQRLHAACAGIRELDVTLCVDLEHLVVVSDALSQLDLSFLTNLRSVYLNCTSIEQLNLTGCRLLNNETVQVVAHGGSLELVQLRGTQLVEREIVQ